MGVAAYMLLADHDATVTYDVLIVGAGVAGCSTGIFTARAGLETLLVDGGEPILARNAHLENYPGFPGGIDARRYLGMIRDQADRAGCDRTEGRVTDLEREDGAFVARTEDGREIRAERVVAASWSDCSYLRDLDVATYERGGKRYVDVDDGGRSTADGIYAAGRLAEEPHQAIVAAGHGAKVGVAIAYDSDAEYYHDWVTPEGYFTGRGRDVPPACEEIDDEERRRREREGRAVLREHLAGDPEGEPTMHPSVDDE